MKTVNSPVTDPLLRRHVVEQATGKSRTTLYRDIKKGLMTKPVAIGGHRVAWPSSEINAINQARIAGRSEPELMALVVELEMTRGMLDILQKSIVRSVFNESRKNHKATKDILQNILCRMESGKYTLDQFYDDVVVANNGAAAALALLGLTRMIEQKRGRDTALKGWLFYVEKLPELINNCLNWAEYELTLDAEILAYNDDEDGQ